MTGRLAEWMPLIVSAAAFVAIVLYRYDQYRKMNKAEQEAAKKKAEENLRRAISDWLLKAVTDAEIALGSGTGKLKIRQVYERAVEVFGPAVYQVITLSQLDAMVQAPLEEMRKMLKSNLYGSDLRKE